MERCGFEELSTEVAMLEAEELNPKRFNIAEPSQAWREAAQ